MRLALSQGLCKHCKPRLLGLDLSPDDDLEDPGHGVSSTIPKPFDGTVAILSNLSVPSSSVMKE